MKHTLAIFCLATMAMVTPLYAGASTQPKSVTITARNFSFTPAVVVLKVKQPVRLTLVSKQGTHGITVPQIGLTQTVTITGKPTSIMVTPQKVGTFDARCAIFCGIGHGKMHMTFRVIK